MCIDPFRWNIIPRVLLVCVDHLFLSYISHFDGIWDPYITGAIRPRGEYTYFLRLLSSSRLLFKMSQLVPINNTLTQCVQEYAAIEDELEELSEKQKVLRKRKQDLETTIIKTMKERNLENRTLKQGQNHFSIKTRKQYSSLTFSYLERSFEKMIPHKDSREMLLEYLRENREVRNVDELKRH